MSDRPVGTTKDESYLGDGLYASFDGFMITLRAPRENGDHWVGLEPETLKALVDFAGHINEKYRVQHFKWQIVKEPHNYNDGTKEFTHVSYRKAGDPPFCRVLIGDHVTPDLAELLVLLREHALATV